MAKGKRADVLDRFSPATAEWFRSSFSAPTTAQAGAWDAISSGHHTVVVAPDRLGQDAVGLPLGDRPDGERAGARGAARALPGPLRLADEGARRRRRAQPARPARRHRPRRHAARAGAARHQRQRPLGRHPGQRAPGLRPHARPTSSSRRPSRSSSCSPPRCARRSRASRRSSSTRSTPSPAPSAARTSPSASSASTRSCPSPPSGSGSRRRCAPSRRWRATSPAGAPSRSSSRSRRSSGSSTSSCPSPTWASCRGRPAEISPGVPDLSGPAAGQRSAGEHLAARRGAHRRPHRRAPLDDRLRQLASSRRAADLAPQRDLGGAARRGGGPARPEPRGALDPAAGAGHGPGRLLPRRARGARPRPPRLGQQGAPGHDRGGPQGRSAARRRRDEQPRARHRHGRRRPRHPGREPAVGGERPAARGPRGPPGRRREPGRHVPEVPRRPRADRRRRRAHARRRHRVAARPGQPRRRARPAGRRDVRHGRLDRRRRRGARPPGGELRLVAALGPRGDARHARRPLPVRRVRRAAPAHRLGPRHRHALGPPWCPAPRRDERRHHPRPGVVCRVPRLRGRARSPGRRARRGDGLRVPRR